MEPDGSGMTQLTHAPANDRYPNWSPETHIVFRRVTPGGEFAIFTMNADGSNLVRLTPGNTGVNTQPVWTPDGTQIVFSSNRRNPSCGSSSFDQCNFQLFIMNADGSNVCLLTSGQVPGLSYALPTVSPDGTMLAFTSFQNGVFSIGTIPMTCDGKPTPTLLTSPRMQAAWPDWSPDGTKIVFSNNGCNGCPPSDIFVMNAADGSGVTRLTHVRKSGNYLQPHWSPDGRMIVFTNAPIASDGTLLPGDIYTMNADGTGIMNLTNSPTVNDETPAWGTAQ
jgi:Tol biopolymer transport system component